jgi:hypothetical protein
MCFLNFGFGRFVGLQPSSPPPPPRGCAPAWPCWKWNPDSTVVQPVTWVSTQIDSTTPGRGGPSKQIYRCSRRGVLYERKNNTLCGARRLPYVRVLVSAVRPWIFHEIRYGNSLQKVAEQEWVLWKRVQFVTLCLRLLMQACPYFQCLLTDLGETRYSSSPPNAAVERLWLSWKDVQWKPGFA